MRRLLVGLSVLAFGLFASAAAAPAETVAIVGTGRVAATLGARTGRGTQATTPEAASAGATLVVLAMPFGTAEATVKRLPLAGDDAEAKQRVAKRVRSFGLQPVDVGPLRHARVLEGMEPLRRVPSLDDRREQGFEYYLRPVAPPRLRSEGPAAE